MGIMPQNLLLISTAEMLVQHPLAAAIGAKSSAESATTGAGARPYASDGQ